METIVSSMVERVARAFADKTYAGGSEVWDTLQEYERTAFYEGARAAILEMRSPTEEMLIKSPVPAIVMPGDTSSYGDWWRAMIDAALEHSQK